MDTPKTRLAVLYERSALSKPELDAAMAGISRFRRFGLQCEGIEVSDRKAVAGVKRGERIREIIARDKAALSALDLGSLCLGEVFRKERPVSGIGIMGGELFHQTDGERGERSTGLSAMDVGGVVTIRRIRLIEDAGLALKTIEAAVAHETGHVLGIKGHCSDDGCLMRENEHLEDFVEITVKNARDLCRRCDALISSHMCEEALRRLS
jgi:hypothetical protein